MSAPLIQSESVETLDVSGAYPKLHDDDIRALAAYGTERPTNPGDLLFREGDPSCDFYVVLEGLVAIVGEFGDEDRVLSVHGPGRFLGELSLVTGQAVFVTAVVREPGTVLVVPLPQLREVVSRDTALGDVILRACMIRRSILIGLGSGLKIVGSRFSPDARRLREFAARNRLPHRWIDLEEDRGAEALLRRLDISPDQTPVVIWRGEVLRNPSTAELARTIGLRAPTTAEATFDLVIVGSGPAGLAAAVYGASEGLKTIALDAAATGGQAGTSSRIENYLGFPSGISGSELADRAVVQAERFGACITVPARASALRRVDGHYVVQLHDGGAVSGRTVLIATGARYRRLAVPRLEKFEGTSVYYAATSIEAHMCGGDPIGVVGGGNSAGQAALFLARHTELVRLLVRGEDLTASMSRYLADRIDQTPEIEVLLHTEIAELIGDRALESLVVEDNRTGERRLIPARALFVFIGADPQVGWLGSIAKLDDRGFVLTGSDAARAGANGMPRYVSERPAMLETTSPGVFVAGDVRSGSIKRVAAAVGEGSMAVRLIHEHLERHWGRMPG